MIFKDLKIGSPFYILSKDDISLKTTKISNITAPHIENKMNSMTQMVVDITVELNGKPVTYIVPDSSMVTYCGQEILTSDKSQIISELKSIKSINEQTVSMYSTAKENIVKCDNLISELDDVYREKKANDERLSKLENMMKSILDKFNTHTVIG